MQICGFNMMQLFTFSWLTFLFISRSHQTDDAVVLVPPQSVNATEGATVTFFCSVKADQINFLINGNSINSMSVDERKGFTSNSYISIDDSKQRNLTAVARADINNNTNITCRALTIGGTTSIDISDPAAILRVQGHLSSVVDLSYSFIDSSTVNISWSPPFTLPGTDITGYNVSVAVMDSPVINDFTTNDYYIFHDNYSHYTCGEEVIITVLGYNGLNGDNTSISIEPIVTNIELSVGNLMEEDQFVKIAININVSNLCPGEYPTHVNLTIQYTSNGIVLVTADNIPLVSTNDTNILTTSNNHSIILLPVDNNYTAKVTFNSLVSTLNFSIHHTMIMILPNDTVGPSVVFMCHFSPYSDAVGCLIELVYSIDNDVQFTGTGNRTDDNVAMVTIDGVYIGGVYQLSVYEIKEDQSVVLARRETVSIFLPSPVQSLPSSIVLCSTVHPPTAIPTESTISATSGSVSAPSVTSPPLVISSDNTPVIIGVTTVSAAVLLLLFVVITVCCYCCYKRLMYRSHKLEKNVAQENDYEMSYLSVPSPDKSTSVGATMISVTNMSSVPCTDRESTQNNSSVSLEDTEALNKTSTVTTSEKGENIEPVVYQEYYNDDQEPVNYHQNQSVLFADVSDAYLSPEHEEQPPHDDEGEGVYVPSFVIPNQRNTSTTATDTSTYGDEAAFLLPPQSQQKQDMTYTFIESFKLVREPGPRRRINDDQSVIYSTIQPSLPSGSIPPLKE